MPALRNRCAYAHGCPRLQGHVHWSDVLLSKVTDTVKLVGPTINCEGSPPSGNVDGEWRRNPHVQSYLVATDRVGLQLLLNARDVFKCYESMWDTIYYSELGSSKAILDAGYNIDSLMVRSRHRPMLHGIARRARNTDPHGERTRACNVLARLA